VNNRLCPALKKQDRMGHLARRAFTLIELLIVVAIIAILAAIAVFNMQEATARARKAQDLANIRLIGTALQAYMVDHNTLPPGDTEAGPFASHTRDFASVGNAPAAGGSWAGVPWLLVDLRYLSDPAVLFSPQYRRQYAGGKTLRGGHARFHNFRYAYNSAGLAMGGHSGGTGSIMNGGWIVRNLWVPAQQGWHAARFPRYPADYRYPYGDGEWEGRLEHVLTPDFAIRRLVGGTNQTPEELAARR
jgi:prepilin-type N-terminal cleavage/methylation domain-containing protein